MHTPHPRRVQVTGSRYAPNLPTGALWAMREAPGHRRSPYANPHAVGPCKKTCGRRAWHDLTEALALYGQHLDANPHIVRQAAAEPAEARFACRCPLYEPCHVDLLLARVDQLLTAA